MNNNIRKAINALKSLDLSIYPIEDILMQFNSLIPLIPIVEETLYPGRMIVRGQIFDSSADYTMISRHSYKPHSKTMKYQRANVPIKPMFYGAVTALNEKEDVPIARQTIMKEIGKIITGGTVLEETYVFSAWEIVEEIKLVAVIQSAGYKKPSALVQKLQKEFKLKFRTEPGREFMNYISSEFSKADTEDDFKYMISAWFSQIVCDWDYDGVIYPSVRMDGASMNIAIKPESIDNKVILRGAGKFEFRKRGTNVIETGHEKII